MDEAAVIAASQSAALDFLKRVRAEIKLQTDLDRLAILAQKQYDAAAFAARIAVGDKARKVLNRVIYATKLDQLFGTDRDVKKLQQIVGDGLSSVRADITMRNLLATAYNAGRFETQLADPNAVFLYYRTMRDRFVRASHRLLDGILALATDPIWREIYPPNGHNCRCRVDALTADEARALVAAGDEPVQLNPQLRRVQVQDRITGQTIDQPDGVDPGWAQSPTDPKRLAELVQRAIFIIQEAPENVV